jgi:signal transduction histidine kinase/DNA-binding LacI/PurR family transcriptional regulator
VRRVKKGEAMPKQRRGKRVFGILLDLLHFGYQETILAGAIDYCRGHDIDLLSFVTGQLLAVGRPEQGKNILFNLVDETNVNGLITITTALQNVVGRDPFTAYLARYYPIPLVSIGEEIPDCPSLVIDNEKGLSELLSHLADIHGYRRLAFITGPRLNSEAQSRFAVYKDFLKARGWPYDPGLVFEGDFTGVSGRRAVAEFLDGRKINYDVIVASNDLMAFGAIEELAFRGIVVPGQTPVVGFDDMANSKNASLTTIRQPLYHEGYMAARTLSRMLDEHEAVATIRLPTELVVRESCGCPSPALAGCETWTAASSSGRAEEGRPEEADLFAAAEAVASLFPSSPACRSWLEALAEALAASWRHARPEEFVAAWRSIIFEAKAAALNLSSLQELLSALRKALIAMRREENRWLFYEDQFHRARVMLEQAVRKEESALRTFSVIREQKLDMVGNKLSAAGSVDELFDVLFEELPSFGVRSCCLSLFEPSLETARLVFAFDGRERFPVPPGGTVFPARSLVPESVLRSDRWRHMAVHALVHQDKNIGFVLFELGKDPDLSLVLEYLRTRISVTLQYMILIREVVSQSTSLEHFNRRLEESNRALQEFAYVVSHDLQEPLRKITTFGERLAGRAKEALDDESRDYLARMQNAAVRMQKLIDSLLSYSRVTTMAKPFVPVDLNQLMKGVLSDLEVRIEKSGARVEVGELPVLTGDPTQLRQLFQNLVGNALKFQPPGGRPVVKVRSLPAERGGRAVLAVEDNGIGIDQKYQDKIFGVFQRLHSREEFEGSGIGLAICKKIMERHGGSIAVESAPGTGATFILRFGPELKPASSAG